ncbi:hypothetical protein B0I35DRAFT_217887 [Stachybotrys elegans]|uniref:Methyltransferase domain-containing protein n=1 Tax=Stachybotrys elegans TaxID=80388 RepID=A0A8K0WR18_9HYPO|nr:hypothetical protein B0I35DRAFT_217887 [Stachybotrys elegans]
MDLLQLGQWSYIPEVPDSIAPARRLLQTYSKLPAEDVDRHILQVREEAWNITRFPCIGRWRFLSLLDTSEAFYRQILFRLTVPKSADALLDLGCGVGQVLRQLRAEGVNDSQLYGTDIEPRLVDLGYDLFQDRHQLNARFVFGDVVDPDDTRFTTLRGKITMVHATSFFHLFNWVQQLYIGKRIVGFLKPGTRNAVIFGRQMGTTKPSDSAVRSAAPYLHDGLSFQRLWDEIGRMTRTKWLVQLTALDEPVDDLAGVLPQHTAPYSFAIYQLP